MAELPMADFGLSTFAFISCGTPAPDRRPSRHHPASSGEAAMTVLDRERHGEWL